MSKKNLTVRMSETEYNIIKDIADLKNMSVNSYLVKNGSRIVEVNLEYSSIKENTETLKDIKNDTQKILDIALRTGEVYSGDIKNIQVLLEEVVKNQQKILQKINKDTIKNNKIIKEELIKELDLRTKKEGEF